jgi:hypothetical protein
MGEDLGHFARGLLDLHERTKAGTVGPHEAIQFLNRHQETLTRNLLHQGVERGRLDVGKAAKDFLEDTFAFHGYEVEVLRAKVVVTAGGIPLEQSAFERHEKFMKGQGKNPLGVHGEYSAPDTNINYYHIDRSRRSHNIVYMNELAAGEMVMDMDGDEATLAIFRRKNAQNKVIEEFMVPYKEPLTQRAPRFHNINYAGTASLDKGDLFGRFAGLNFGQLGDQVANDSVKAAFSGELAARKYSLAGDFLREYRAGVTDGFGASRNLDSVVTKIAEKQLKENMVGITTNVHDIKAMYDVAKAVHVLREQKSEHLIKELQQQQNTAELLLNERKKYRSTQESDAFDHHLESLLANRDNPLENSNLIREYQRTILQKQFLDDPKRVYDIEIGGLKVSRSANISASDISNSFILNDFRFQLRDPEFLLKGNKITNLSQKNHIEAVQKFFANQGDDAIRASFGDVSIGDFEEIAGSWADKIAGTKKYTEVGEFNLGKSSTFERLLNSGVIKTSPLQVERDMLADHLLDSANFSLPTAFYLRDSNGLVGPQRAGEAGETILDGFLIGNIAKSQNGGLAFQDNIEYVATELERRMAFSFPENRGFGQTTHQLAFDPLLSAMEGGNRNLRNQILESFGVNYTSEDKKLAWAEQMARNLRQAGKDSALHQEIALKYDMSTRGYMFNQLRSHLNDIVSAAGGIGDASLKVQNGHIIGANPLDVRKVASGYAIDTGYINASLDTQKDLVGKGIHMFGGFTRKNTSQESSRYLHMTYGSKPKDLSLIGLADHHFFNPDLARRASDIQRQMPGGTQLKGVKMVLGDTDISRKLFDMYNPDAGMGAKRHDEGLILMSKSFQKRMMDDVKKTLRVGPSLTEIELHRSSEEYANYMMGEARVMTGRNLTSAEAAAMREKMMNNYRKFYEKSTVRGETRFSLNAKGFDRHLSEVTKLGSLLGDKAVVQVVDDLSINGESADIFMHVNQARARSNILPRLQQIAEQALKRGELSADDFEHGVVQDGKVRLNHLFESSKSEEEFMGKVGAFLKPLEKTGKAGSITVNGKTQHITGGLLGATVDDFFAVGNHGDVFKQLEPASISARGMSRSKILGRIANAFDHELGGIIANAGAQFLMQAGGQMLQNSVKVTDVISGLTNLQSHDDLIKSTQRLIALGAAKKDALEDVNLSYIDWANYSAQ